MSSEGCFSRASQNRLGPRRVMSSPGGQQGFGYFYTSFPAPGTSASSLDQHQEMPKAAGINTNRDNINHQTALSHQTPDFCFSQQFRMVLISSRLIHPSQLALYSTITQVPP